MGMGMGIVGQPCMNTAAGPQFKRIVVKKWGWDRGVIGVGGADSGPD